MSRAVAIALSLLALGCASPVDRVKYTPSDEDGKTFFVVSFVPSGAMYHTFFLVRSQTATWRSSARAIMSGVGSASKGRVELIAVGDSLAELGVTGMREILEDNPSDRPYISYTEKDGSDAWIFLDRRLPLYYQAAHLKLIQEKTTGQVPGSTPRPAPAPKETHTNDSTTGQNESKEPNRGPKRELSPGLSYVIKRYSELQRFRSDPKLREYGFSANGPYHWWLKDVQDHGRGENSALSVEEQVLCTDLVSLGFAYMRGRADSHSRSIERRIEAIIRGPLPELEVAPQNRVLGRWSFNGVPHEIRQEGREFLMYYWVEGSTKTYPPHKLTAVTEKEFHKTDEIGSGSGEYYIIEVDGSLAIHYEDDGFYKRFAPAE